MNEKMNEEDMEVSYREVPFWKPIEQVYPFKMEYYYAYLDMVYNNIIREIPVRYKNARMRNHQIHPKNN